MKLSDTEKRVVRAAMRWFRQSGGFFHDGLTYVKLPALADKLEDACAAHARAKRKRK